MKLIQLNVFVSFCLLLITQVSTGQETLSLEVNWGEDITEVYNEKDLLIPSIKGQGYNGVVPNFNYTELIKGNFNKEVTSFTVKTIPATSTDLNLIDKFQIEIPTSVQLESGTRNGADLKYFEVYCFPYVKESDGIKRIVTIDLSIQSKPTSVNYLKGFVTESVLKQGSGTWYKIAVRKDGIYKIDKTFLESCGISTEGLNPTSINIYGNGDGRLPELNSVYRTDDLEKNAIYIEGESDGVFDDNDYVLFYGWGPDRWSANGTSSFKQDKNIYSNTSCYFINIDPNNTPKRVQLATLVDVPATNTINSYSFRDVHEVDLVSPVNGGQRWYGELFDTQLSQTFPFSVPNPEVGIASTFKVTIGSNNKVSAGTEQRYTLNGTVVQSAALPTGGDYGRSTQTLNFTSGSTNLLLNISITRNTPDVMTYLDRIVLNTRRNLVFYGDQFDFIDLSSVGTGNIGEFTVSNFPSDGWVWDITDRHNPKRVQGTLSGTNFIFKNNLDTITEYVASNNLNFYEPEKVGEVEYQNLHALPQADYLIVTHKNFISQAERLANLHRSTGMSVHVVTTEQVYNEFSSGTLDPTAIKMFAKMFYDRSFTIPDSRPKYLCLFGDGTYDPKNRVANNNNYVPTYQMVGSDLIESHIYNLVTDDYYAMLDDNEAISSIDKVDIGVGRLLISDNQMAKEQVDKIEHYMKNGSTLFANDNVNCIDGVSTSTFGDWRAKYVNIGDDEEQGYFLLNDLEPAYNYTVANHPEMNADKIYLDAYPQVSTAGGARYPDVFNAITDRIERGALVVNYVGHGGEVGVAEERVITVPQIQSWKNIDNLPIMVSATCEFTKYDDPDRVSAGEWVSLNPVGGAIALMTTSRSVYFTVNTNTVEAFFNNVFVRNTDNSPRTFGDIIRFTKISINDQDNKRSFTLIGDPALRIALPRYKLVLDSVNGISPAIQMDTIRALSKVKMKGHIEDDNGNLMTNFNGVASPSIYDKPKQLKTLGQDPNSPVLDFELQRSVIYKGKATVTNGLFEFEFVTPKDIDYSYGNGKVSLYANSNVTDGVGQDTRVIIGGIDPNGISDDNGPTVDLYLNNENFVNGGITDETPYLIARLFDENGINTVGNGIGHDILVILDEDSGDPIVLNDYYSADLDTYKSGEIRYQFSELEAGNHTISLKVWDVNNNSTTSRLEFVVQEQAEFKLDHVLNYPNPFTTKTEFYFEHNQCCTDLEAQIQIFTVSGRLVKTINERVNTAGFRSNGIFWDGRDDFGDQLAKGVYVYRLVVRMPDGQVAEKIEKLVLLR